MTGIEFSPDKFAKAAKDAVDILDRLVGLPQKIREAYREFELDRKGIVQKMNDRLYTRYLLIGAVENFGKRADRESAFKEIVAKAQERANYLKEFDETVPPRLKNAEPELAAYLTIMTKQSIQLYQDISRIENADRFAEFAPALADYLATVATDLQRVNDKLKAIASKP